MITHPSPSLVARQPPGGMASDLRAQENAINIELNRIPPPVLNALKQEAGLGDKDMMSLTIEEKVSKL
jgi:collagen type III alpha